MKAFSWSNLRPSALEAAGSFDGARALARMLIAAAFASVLALVFVPWQQSVSGTGRLIAYAPLERQQSVEAPIDGRLVEWYVQEGEHVEAGQPIAELSDNDPNIMDRLGRERDAAQAQVEAAQRGIEMMQAQIGSLESLRDATVGGAELRRQMAGQRLDAAQRALDAAKAAHKTAQLNLERQKSLHDKGLASTRTLELATLEEETTLAELDRSRASLKAARQELEALGTDRSRASADTQAKIESARTSLESQKAAKAKAQAELAKVEVRLARQSSMQITAPRSGTVFRMIAKQGGEMVKAGDELVVLVPDTDARAVELWVDGNDAPLITPGRHVRLQFEGWPAVQFVGWPSVAVGTFAGEVAFVDPTDDGAGRFRVVIVPEDDSWPDPRYLRQGVRANGWILLNQVPLGYELWRQFNGFPPAIEAPEGEGTSKAKEGGKA